MSHAIAPTMEEFVLRFSPDDDPIEGNDEERGEDNDGWPPRPDNEPEWCWPMGLKLPPNPLPYAEWCGVE